MNVKRKSKLDVVIRILLIALVAVLVVFAVKVVFSAAKTAPVAADAAANEDKSVIGEFQAGTYGGIKMDTAEDAVKYYVEAYNKTKAETAEFNTPDGKQTWSAFIGDEDLKINSVIIDGNENKTINSMVPGIVGGIFHSGTSALPPTAGKNLPGTLLLCLQDRLFLRCRNHFLLQRPGCLPYKVLSMCNHLHGRSW